MSTRVDLSIVIVSWNVRELLRANLARLREVAPGLTKEVFVVDNGSADGTAYLVRAEFPEVRLITNAWDAGFAGPNNQALRLAQGDVCLLLNPDMLVEPGALEKTVETLRADASIGVMGIRLMGSNGKPINSVRRDPDVWSQLAIILKLQHLFPSIIKRYMRDDFDYFQSQEADHVRGSFFAFRREMLKEIGFLDEKSFHLWFEEVDFCVRARRAGLRIWYEASVFAHDYVGKSFSQMPRLETQWIFTTSMLAFFRKWRPRWERALLAVARPFGLAMAALVDAKDYVVKSLV
jgi:GT2 family glycosyltransferase